MHNPFGPHRGDGAPAPGPDGRVAVVPVVGDVTVPTARALHRSLRAAARRDVDTVVLDCARAGRFDSAAVAVIAVATRRLTKRGKRLELRHLGEHHRAALALVPKARPAPEPTADDPGFLEGLGGLVYLIRDRVRQIAALFVEVAQQTGAVVTRRQRLPAGAFVHQAVTMGADALWIVGALGFLLGMTLAFQGATLLARFGAGPYVADLIGVSVVREFAPMMTAIILAGRAGAAIAAELGTMRAGSEIDALDAMGLSPVRFLVLPRLGALTLTQPMLTLLAMFLGIGGGVLVAALTLDMEPATFAARVVDRVQLGDFVHGLGKSLVFAWIIGGTGVFYGLHTRGNASAVGAATTRTVVVAVTLILGVDAAFATVATLRGPG